MSLLCVGCVGCLSGPIWSIFTAICVLMAALECSPHVWLVYVSWTRQLWEEGNKNNTLRLFHCWNYATVLFREYSRLQREYWRSSPHRSLHLSLSLSSCPSSSISSCSPSSLQAEALSASASTSPTRLLSHNPATSWCTAAFTPLGGRAAFDLGFSADPSCQTKSLCCVKEKGHSMQMKKEAEFQRGKHVKPSS